MKPLSLSHPHAIIMVGLPGSGKTFFAEKFSDTFSAPFVALERITPFCDDPTSAATIAYHQIQELLKTQQTIIIETRANTPVERSIVIDLARSKGYKTLLVWVQTDLTTTKLRCVRTTKDSSRVPMTVQQYTQLAEYFTPPRENEKPVVISGKHTYATQAKTVLTKVSAPRAETTTRKTIPARKAARGRRNVVVT